MRALGQRARIWPTLYVFCGRHLLAAKLRPSNIDASAGSVEEAAWIVSAPPSNSATTAFDRSNMLGSVLHCVCIGPTPRTSSSRSGKTTFA
jgi:hypothetical protein